MARVAISTPLSPPFAKGGWGDLVERFYKLSHICLNVLWEISPGPSFLKKGNASL
jgi:hypothetical protein